MSEGRKPKYNIRLSYRDGREQEFDSYSGKEIKSKYRNIGAAWEGQYEETPLSLNIKGATLILEDGTKVKLDDAYLDLRLPYDADRKPSKTTSDAAKKAGAKMTAAKRAPVADPFA